VVSSIPGHFINPWLLQGNIFHAHIGLNYICIYTIINMFCECFQPAPYTLHVKNIQIQKCGSRSRLIELKDINVTQVKNTYEMSAKFQAKTHINKPLKVL